MNSTRTYYFVKSYSMDPLKNLNCAYLNIYSNKYMIRSLKQLLPPTLDHIDTLRSSLQIFDAEFKERKLRKFHNKVFTARYFIKKDLVVLESINLDYIKSPIHI